MILASVAFFSNCKKEEVPPATTGTLEVLAKAKATGAYLEEVAVNLFNSKEDMDSNIILKTAPTGTGKAAALFSSLAPQEYYANIDATYGGKVYSGNTSVSIIAGDTARITISCNALGNLEVFVHQELPTGPYIGGAKVTLYKSIADRTNGIVFMTSYTNESEPIKYGAYFPGLPFQKYYVHAEYSNTYGDFAGDGESYAPKDTKTQLHVVCVK
ncbi:hypothetical protein ACFLRI_01025 [Bacteroidota bacterium]